METESKKEYIKSWKSELDNLRTIFCYQPHKTQLNYHIQQIDRIIEQIAEHDKDFTEE